MKLKWKRLLMSGSLVLGLFVLAAIGYSQTGGDIVGSVGPKFFSAQSSDPIVPAGKASIYAKEVNGKPEFFFKNGSNSTQVTSNGVLKITESDPLAIHTETDPLAIHTEADPLSLHTNGTDIIKKEHIDWGTGEHQVNADDIPDGAVRSLPLASDVAAGVTAHGWGNHAEAGYLTQESDPLAIHEESDPLSLHAADSVNVKASHIDWGTDANQVNADSIPSGTTNIIPTSEQVTNWDAAFGWGNHADAGYLFIGEATSGLYPQSMGEGNWQWAHISADDISDSETKAVPTLTQQSNWDAAYGWGNHASAGYLTSLGSALLDEDFTTNGLMQRTGAGTYGTITDGQNGQYLKTNGSGSYSWASVATGGVYSGVCTVAKSGGDYSTIQAALNAVWGTNGADGSCNGRAVGTLSVTNKWVVLVYPGDYSETLVGKNFVSLVSAEGPTVTRILGGTRAINGSGCSVNIAGFTISAGCGGSETGVIELSNCSDGSDDIYGIRDNVIIGSSCGNPIVGIRGTHTAGKAFVIERNHFFGPTTSDGYGSAVGVTSAGNWYLDNNTSENWSNFALNNNGSTIYAHNNKVLSGYNGFQVESGGHGFKTWGNSIKATNGFYIHCHNGGIYSCWSTAQATSYGDQLDVTTPYVLSGNSTKQFNKGAIKEPSDLVVGGIQSGFDGFDGQIKIYSEQGATDYTYTINPNAAATQDVVLTLPPDDGTSGQYLQTDGSGNLTWASVAGGHTQNTDTQLDTGTVSIDPSTKTVTIAQHISNPITGTFEAGVEGWTKVSGTAASNPAQSSTYAHGGTNSLALQNGSCDSAEWKSAATGLTRGVAYRFTFWTRSNVGTQQNKIHLGSTNADSNTLCMQVGATTTWVQYSCVQTLEVSGDDAIHVKTGECSQITYFDDLVIDKAADADVDIKGDLTANSLTVGRNGQDGTITLYSEQGATDYSYTLQPNAAATQNVTLTLPPDDGNANNLLRTDGSGNLSFVKDIVVDSLTANTLTEATTNQGIAITSKANFSKDVAISSADFTVNTDDLFIDQSANRIGLFTNSPEEAVHIAQNVLVKAHVPSPFAGTFEVNEEGWTKVSGNVAAAPSQTSAQAHSGSYSLALQNGSCAAAEWKSAATGLPHGVAYTLTYWGRANAGTQQNYVYIGSQNRADAIPCGHNSHPSTGWTQYTCTQTLPSGGDDSIWVYTGECSQTSYFDDMTIESAGERSIDVRGEVKAYNLKVNRVEAASASVDYKNVNILEIPQADLTASCTTGQLRIDNGGATTELCYCTATDTWKCTALAAGPAD